MIPGKERLFKALNYVPLPKQLKFHSSERKFRGYLGGLGSGKTLAGAYEAVCVAMTWPGTTGFVLAPTNKLLKESTMKVFFKVCPANFIKKINRTDNKVTLINNTELLFRNCEDEKSIDRLRNIEIGFFWIDEARGVPGYIWNVAIGRLRQKNAPLTGWITTTNKGFNWIYKKFAEKPRENYWYIISSSRENIHLPDEYLNTLDAEYTGKFAEQEIEGKFVGFEGVVYEEFDRKIHVIKDAVIIENKEGELGIKILETQKKIYFKEIILGIDWGYTNPTAIPVIGIDNDKRMYIIDEFYEKNMLIDNLKQILRNYMKEYNYRVAFADPSEPDFIVDLNNEQLKVEKAINAIVPGISEVSNRLKVREDNKPRFFVLEKCTNTIKEFENYRYKDVKEEKPEDEKPLKVDDHLMDAIRYAAMGIKEDVEGSISFI